MPRHDPLIRRRAARQARLFQLAFPLIFRLGFSSPALQFATKNIARPATVAIPTRHGRVRALVYSPPAADVARQERAGQRPPVHLITHGGAFVIRVPEQEDNVARYLASEIGGYGYYRPLAVSSEFGVTDMSLPDETRTSRKKHPVVGPRLMKLVRETYFAGVRLEDPLASPARHPRLAELPPVLIETGGLDTLKHESNALAADLARQGVRVTHREFADVDHGFTHAKPAAVAREAVRLLGEHLATAYAAALETNDRH